MLIVVVCSYFSAINSSGLAVPTLHHAILFIFHANTLLLQVNAHLPIVLFAWWLDGVSDWPLSIQMTCALPFIKG